MDRLDADVLRRALALVERYDLHDARAFMPVPVRQVAKDEGWTICYRGGMGKVIAMAFVVGPIRLMYVNENLTTATQRMGMAHEMGHILCQHGVGVDVYGAKSLQLAGTSDLEEAQASLVAAVLLIPVYLRDAPLSDREVATVCCVPISLVKLFREASPVPLLAVA